MANRNEAVRISKARFQSPNYVMKPDRYKYIRPIIIANWEMFQGTNNVIMMENPRIPRCDVKLIKESLQEKYGIGNRCLEFNNLSKDNLMMCLSSVAKSIPTKGKRRPDMFMCFIIARGRRDHFYDVPPTKVMSQEIYFTEIMKLFNAENCPGLAFRPKLFFVQTEGKPRQILGGQFLAITVYPDFTPKTFPLERDFFIYTSTDIADRETSIPSSFVQYLCEELKDKGENQDIETLTVNVNNKMGKRYLHNLYIPTTSECLTKKLYLQPPQPGTSDTTRQTAKVATEVQSS